MDPLHKTLLALNGKLTGLNSLALKLGKLLTGKFDHDAPIKQQMLAIHGEAVSIQSRLAALESSSPFTAPDQAQIDELMSAIAEVNQAVKSTTAANEIMAAAERLLKAYGAAESG